MIFLKIDFKKKRIDHLFLHWILSLPGKYMQENLLWFQQKEFF